LVAHTLWVSEECSFSAYTFALFEFEKFSAFRDAFVILDDKINIMYEVAFGAKSIRVDSMTRVSYTFS